MPALAPDLRRALEKAVVHGREAAESGATAAVAVLAVESNGAPAGLSPADRLLRAALRARAKSLGAGVLHAGIESLIEEIAYEQWHRMLFARFLAENGLLRHPSGAPVNMAEVTALAAEEGERDPWVLAANYGAAMLPGIFRRDDPAHQVRFAPEHRRALENILAALPPALFTADDALGWVYQFWQAKRKDDVNKSGRKIGGADLAPVTQLFTEHYMVRFLLENSLGAWWAARHPGSALLREWKYLRFRDDGTPAAGAFPGWPDHAAEVTVMDPCCGSGHFLVAAAEMLRAMRIEEEGLTKADAAVVVLRDNLFGLELDPRCTQLAAFALAFDAWKVAGYRELPVPNIACTGIAVKGQLEDWRRLAGSDDNMRAALERLYTLFQDAPELGSLIDPAAAAGEGLWKVDPDALLAKLDEALKKERDDPAATVFGAAAEGTAKAARLLSRKYWLVATNPPFLGRGKMSPPLRDIVMLRYGDASPDLATVVQLRCRTFMNDHGGYAAVSPTAWTLLGRYEPFRRGVLRTTSLHVVARLGPGAFDAISGEVVNVCLILLTVPRTVGGEVVGLTAEASADAGAKANDLRAGTLSVMPQTDFDEIPDARLVFGRQVSTHLLSDYAQGLGGITTGDGGRHRRCFWELNRIENPWTREQNAPEETSLYAGRSYVLEWNDGAGLLPQSEGGGATIAGRAAWGHAGIGIRVSGSLDATIYRGDIFENVCAVILPHDSGVLPAIWCYCSSSQFYADVRAIDTKIGVTNQTLAKVPFDLAHWQKVAADKYPKGLPEPHSDDPTQWLFKGHPEGSEAPLQVAVARLLGYRWPDQERDELDELADGDGIVCLPSIAGEATAAERLRVLLARAYGREWSPALADRLVAEAGSPALALDRWLREDFFAQHARLFHNRPFIWQIWDGRKDGFSALLNYHRLDRRTLEKVTYAHLSEWIERQQADREQPGAEARLVAALELKKKLGLILEGEPPYDIYVRWKPLERQPIGWEPDLDDGVRLNIRPFVTAGVLRAKFTINWNKDRGTDPDGTERLNNLHYTRAKKMKARENTQR